MRKFFAALILAMAVLGILLWILLQAGSDRGSELSGTGSGVAGDPLEALDGLSATEEGAEDAVVLAPGEGQPAGGKNALLYGRVSDERGYGLWGAKILVVAGADYGIAFMAGGGRDELFRERLLGKSQPGRWRRSVAEGLTNEQGEYAIPLALIPPGEYVLLARHEDCAPLGKGWTRTAQSSEVNFELGPGDWIEGVVAEREGGPIAEAVVEAVQGGRGRGRGRGLMGMGGTELADRTKTDASGRFRLTVSSGTFSISARAAGYVDETVDEVASGTRDVRILLGPSSKLVATVVDSSRKPIASALVSLYPGNLFGGGRGGRGGPGRGRGGWTPERMTKLIQPPQQRGETGASGTIAFLDVATVSYSLLVERASFVTTWHRGRLEADATTTQVEIALESAALLSGTVSDPGGKPVVGAFVAVGEDRGQEGRDRRGMFGRMGRGPGRGGPRKGGEGEAEEEELLPPEPISLFRALAGTETDARGRFSFNTIRSGLYALSVQSNDFTPYRQDGIQLEEKEELSIVLDPGIRLEGRVVSSADRSAVPDVAVSLMINFGDRRSARGDTDGVFVIGGLFPGRIDTIQFRAKGYAVAIEEGVEITGEEAVQRQEFAIDPSGLVSGVVTDKGGAPVVNARVRIAPVVGGGDRRGGFRTQIVQSALVRTNGRGNFLFRDVTASPQLRVTITHADFKGFQSDPFPLAPGERKEDLTFRLSAGGRLVAWVRDPEGTAVPRAQVRLTRQVSQEGEDRGGNRGGRFRGGRGRFGGGGVGSTGPDGKVIFSGLEGGDYVVSCAVEGFQPFTDGVSVVEETEATLAIDLLPENVITGIVGDTEGVPVPGAEVIALAAGSGRPWGMSRDRTADDGTFRLGSLGEGEYSLQVRSRGFAEKTIEKVKVNTDIAITLERLGGIAGSVAVAETGEPVTVFQIILREEGSRASERREDVLRGRGRGGDRRGGRRRSFEDPNGLFLLEEVAPGSYILEVTAEGLSGRQVRVRVREGAVREGVEVLLEEGLSVSAVVVKKGTSDPVPGAEIFIIPVSRSTTSAERRRQDRSRAERNRDSGREEQVSFIQAPLGQANAVGETDGAGVFALRDLRPGRYEIIVNHPDFAPARQRVEIPEDGVAQDLLFQLDKGVELRGTVRNSDTSPAAGALVSLRDASGITKSARADDKGRYRVFGLVPGNYTFSVRTSARARPASRQVTIKKRSNRLDYVIPASR